MSMQEETLRILVVDDEPDIREVVKEILSDEGYQVTTVHDADAARSAVRLTQFSAILLDIWMPGDDGVTLLKEWRESGLDTPVIMMSGHGTVETAVEATVYGAYDYLEKPVSMGRLLVAIRNAVSSRQSTPFRAARKEIVKSKLVGSSAAIANVMRQVKNIARHPTTVMIIGEPGSGKKFVANLIHAQAEKDPSKFVIFDLLGNASIDEMIAQMQELGVDGTVVIPDMHGFNGQLQVRLTSLLNRLEQIQKSAGESVLPRMIVTATPGIATAVKNAYFRSDLFHRLRDSVIELPALRDRPEDIPELVGFFTDHFSQVDRLPYRRMSTSALNRLRNHSWSGNVEELQNVIRQALMNTSNDVISTADLNPLLAEFDIPAYNPPESSSNDDLRFDLPIREAREQFEREYLIYNLRSCASYKEMQARTGMDRTNLYRKLKKYEIDIAPGSAEQAEK